MASHHGMKLILIALACAFPALSQQIFVKLDTKLTQINFTLGDILHTVHGAFTLIKGDYWFNPSSGEAGGQLSVDAKSGNSGSQARDSRMTTRVLQADQYPLISFVPDHINGKANLSGHSEFRLHGILAIHGNPHELTMDVRSDIQAADLKAQAAFDVPYVQWGMKNPSTLMLRVNPTVHIEIRAIGQIVPGSRN
jgi:polyisoprenoid-binding protein YceI